ncbi:hypothetical protein LCI18_002211 [Fusarium solani-melongenae]|uniref:Uncharacterized protein n=1 Tax=Fusarium solani subsp. cucurbitae TaxID=2747967 RepID=A0ACD3YQX4_FUSSC|nr:hypothetical protein LCI18_002211 [Fusarium solani-melongenae]
MAIPQAALWTTVTNRDGSYPPQGIVSTLRARAGTFGRYVVEAIKKHIIDDDVGKLKSSKELYRGSVSGEGGKKLGHSFTVIEDGLQVSARTQSSKSHTLKGNALMSSNPASLMPVSSPVGGWTLDKKLAEIGRFTQLTLENDMEGYTPFLWTSILGWPQDE